MSEYVRAFECINGVKQGAQGCLIVTVTVSEDTIEVAMVAASDFAEVQENK